ncbi:cysteine desulfurase [Haloactinopolyspora alba]|uniref:Cysteine desulfurase n=1 Tax=Haloactinopolyspora alba TaxID=648780 RepID=A0A2P8DWN0_9ACTN|nr:cysteine desulfurase family protein [Haloactinopolyspora alba]PSL01639.1 cysteine desulfurase [Haloactinopolyspora alba]
MNTAEHPALADGPVYLDYNATTPVDPRVVDAMSPYLTRYFGNPSSDHAYGAPPGDALDIARAQVGALIGADAGTIVFTGSGSEADQLAIRGVVLGADVRRPHVITQVTEHPAVLETCRSLERLHGVRVTYLPVDTDGVVDPSQLAAALTDDTVLVTVMAANNETGTLQPVPQIAHITHAHGALLHCDAAQAAGKIPVDVAELGADLLTVVGHKMYAPKGIAALHVGDGVRLEPVIYGGGQENGRRGGTENVALAAGLGTAARLAADELGDSDERIDALRDQLLMDLSQRLPGRVTANAAGAARLPNTLSVSVEGTRGHQLLAAVPEIAASTGSACHSGQHSPSPVLAAMGLEPTRALATIRLSLGRWSTPKDVDTAAALIARAAAVSR